MVTLISFILNLIISPKPCLTIEMLDYMNAIGLLSNINRLQAVYGYHGKTVARTVCMYILFPCWMQQENSLKVIMCSRRGYIVMIFKNHYCITYEINTI